MLKIDPQLVSGFLSAISGLFSELKSDLVKERTILRIFTEEIGDRAFKIITVEGTNSVTAVILDRTPKYLNNFKRRIRNFSYAFEKEFHTKLEEFVGVLDEFTPAIKLLDQHLGLSLMTPLQINRAHKGEISHPTLYEIISKQIDQLAITEGLFAIEIVNQCLLDSDYSYREITEIIISFLHDGVLLLVDQHRTLPSFVSPLPSGDLQQPKLKETVFKESVEELTALHSITEPLDSVLDEEPQEMGVEDVKWFTELIPNIQANPLPDNLKSDILERDLIFESELRIRSNSIRSVTYSESDLVRWANLMTQKGFTLHHKTVNPLNGVKIILRSDLSTIITSIIQLKTGDYLFIIGEAE